MDDQAKAAEDAVMEDPQVKADQAKLAQDIEALRAKRREADEAREREEEDKAKQAARDVEAARAVQAGELSPAGGAAVDIAAKQREENLARARENGYRDPDPIDPVARVKAVLTAMEHAIKHNAPVTMEMVSELREVLNVPADPKPSDDETDSDTE